VSGSAVGDLFAALALMAVFEGLALALFSNRLAEMLEALRALDADRLRWAGLIVAVGGTGLYVAIRL